MGLSLGVLLAQNHEVTVITTTEDKAEKLNRFISPIRDREIERFFRDALSDVVEKVYTRDLFHRD